MTYDNVCPVSGRPDCPGLVGGKKPVDRDELVVMVLRMADSEAGARGITLFEVLAERGLELELRPKGDAA